MSGKKLVNSAESCVEDMLQGLKACYQTLAVNPQLGLTFFNEHRGNKVALLSGGGSGHEPFSTGYIDGNMLTGAVSGLVFTSPPVSNVFSAIHFLSRLNKGGVLVIIMNYTGDQLNFGLAIEHAKSKGIHVESISINDDCALLGHDTLSLTGKRGISGCAFVFKILGSFSESGATLDALVKEYKEIEPRLASAAACLRPCSLPSSGSPLFSLGDEEISLGCGVHGEAGIATIKLCSLQDLVEKVLAMIYDTGVLKFGNHVCAMIGNLGSSTQMECLIVAKVVKEQLIAKGLVVERLYQGTVMSSLDMKGFQISLLNVTDRFYWLNQLDLPTEAFGWPGTALSYRTHNPDPVILSVDYSSDEEQFRGLILNNEQATLFLHCVIEACMALKANVGIINQLDSECGDGDCGSTLGNLADGILLKKDTLNWKNVGKTLAEFSRIAESQMGGTSGAVYSLLFQGAAKSASSWHSSWAGALETLSKYSPARIGHRTLVDALAPACEAYAELISNNGEDKWKEALGVAVQKAQEGCESTLTLKPKLGRACYAESSRISSVDAGAYGVTIWLSAINNSLQ